MTTFQVLLVDREDEPVVDYLTNEGVPEGPGAAAARLASILARRLYLCPRRHSVYTVKVRDTSYARSHRYWFTASVDGLSTGVETRQATKV